MIYVDKDLCTGCGVCVDVCHRGALSLRADGAVIDESLCTSCGHCLDSCVAGAIISLEVNPPPVPTGFAQRPSPRVFEREYPFLPSTSETAAPVASQPASTSKLDLIVRVFDRLFGIATYALEQRRGKSSRTIAATGRCSRGGRGRRNRQSQGLGGRRWGGRGLRGAGGKGRSTLRQ